MDYVPDTYNDPTFYGLEVDCPEDCHVHKLEPVKGVVFEGTNTSRRFYMFSVQSLFLDLSLTMLVQYIVYFSKECIVK
jgi:hypothetical protein